MFGLDALRDGGEAQRVDKVDDGADDGGVLVGLAQEARGWHAARPWSSWEASMRVRSVTSTVSDLGPRSWSRRAGARTSTKSSQPGGAPSHCW